MRDARTTIVICQRERYTPSTQFLEPILDPAGTAARAVVLDRGSPDAPRIHMAGGPCRIVDVDGRRRILVDMDLYDVPAAEARPRAPFHTDYLEYHCVLLRTDVVRGDGMHDDRLRSGHDMYDLA